MPWITLPPWQMHGRRSATDCHRFSTEFDFGFAVVSGTIGGYAQAHVY